jgi:ribonuclease BN (tRNA processing enzyme)
LPDKNAPVLKFERLSSGQSYSVGEHCIEMIAVNHSVSGVAYRIEGDRHALAFSGDTTTNDTLWAALNRHDALDVLLTECAFPKADRELSRASGHYCPSLLAEDLIKLHHRPRTYITHLKPGAEKVTMEEIQRILPEFEVRRLLGGEVFEL